MSYPNVKVSESLEELSRTAAGRFVALATRNASQGRCTVVALSGGSTPRKLYEMLANPALAIPWGKVHLFQVDERCVPPDDAESNYRMIREALLAKIQIPEGNFHRIRAEMPDRDEAAKLYAAEIGKVLPAVRGAWPVFDLIFLGMGADGHTASLFPGSAGLAVRDAAVCANYSERLGMHRITLTFPVLNSATEIIFLVSGQDKAATLREVFEGPGGIYPVQRIQPESGNVTWLVERAAAKLLKPSARNAP